MSDERTAPFATHLLRWLYHTLQPAEGWLAVLLTLALLVVVTQSVADTEWVDFPLKLQSTALIGAVLTLIIAKQKFSTARAVLLILAYGIVTIVLRLGDWWPPLEVWLDGGFPAAQAFARPQFALFVNELATWGQRLATGEPSQAQLPFALMVAFVGWLCAAYLTWAAFHINRPLPALTLLGCLFALNSYFSYNTEPTTIVLYLMLAFALVAVVRWRSLERYWEYRHIDYSDELRGEFILIVGLLAAVLPIAAFWLPPLTLAPISGRFAESAWVMRAEAWLDRAFGGLNIDPNQSEAGLGDGGDGRSRTGGVLPRAYLLGDAPELYETLVMTATVQFDASALAQRPQLAQRSLHQLGTHWRALSYDVYSGRGWWRSETTQRPFGPDQPLAQSMPLATVPVIQQVNWLADNRLIRYSFGRPHQFDQPVETYWMGPSDLSHVHGRGPHYQILSQVSIATPAMLNQTTLADVPPLIAAAYTQLPDSVPVRVHQLAAEITADAATPYEKAVAIEAFVRQYEYSLDVSAPPADRDVVDFFLFEQQAGYCDYFATAMTVLARSAGLPARLAIGFNPNAADANGVQSIYEIDGHSWTEIYFADYGWIEFEPTATFVNAAATDRAVTEGAEAGGDTAPPPIPDRAATWRTLVGTWGGIFGGALAVGVIIWLRRPAPTLTRRYARLVALARRLPIPVDACQTPFEFEQQLVNYLQVRSAEHWLLQGVARQAQVKTARRAIGQTVAAFVAQQYGEKIEQSPMMTGRTWRQLVNLLLLLRWSR